MKLITAIPIYRNKFQKPSLFFSMHDFSMGSIVFAPLPSSSTSQKSKEKKEKPVIVIEVNNLEEKKSFIRRNKIKIGNIKNKLEFPLFKKEIIEIIKVASEKTNHSIEEILQKILTKKTIQEINKISASDKENIIENIKKITDKLSIDLIRKKLRKTKTIDEKKDKGKGIKTIGSLLEIKEIKKTSLHSEKHYLVNEIRNYFGETTKKGKGSFGFYLGFFNRIPKHLIYEYWAEVKQSRKTIPHQQKIFWWKIGQYLRNKK